MVERVHGGNQTPTDAEGIIETASFGGGSVMVR